MKRDLTVYRRWQVTPLRARPARTLNFDGDGYLDLATANYGSDNVSVLLNQALSPIPTLSEWGMIVLALLILAIGTVAVIRRRRVVSVSE